MSVAKQLRSDFIRQCKQCQQEVEKSFNQKALAEGRNGFAFRSGPLPIDRLFYISANMGNGTIFNGLHQNGLFDSPELIPTPSAFVQRRDLVPEWAFQNLYFRFTDSCLDILPTSPWHIYAGDGSTLYHAPNPSDPDSYFPPKKDEGRAHNGTHLNALAEVNSRIIVDAILQGEHVKDERAAMRQLFIRYYDQYWNNPVRLSHTIFLLDRGYEGYQLCTTAITLGMKILVRLKSPSSNGMLSGLSRFIPQDQDEFDVPVDITLTRSHKSEIRLDPSYQILNTNQTCEECTKDHDVPISFRLVAVRLDNGEMEYLLTNLPDNEFSADRLKGLYFRRWSLETGFRFLKYTVGLNCFHARKIDAVHKEIWMNLLLYNMSTTITFVCAVSHKTKTYAYQICFARAVTVIRQYLLSSEIDQAIEAIIQRNLVPIKENRSFHRDKIPRKPMNFYYRTA